MRTIIFVFLFLLSTITPVQALTAGDWLNKSCQDGIPIERTENLSMGHCIGYMGGVMNTILLMQKFGFPSCLPRNVTSQQLMAIAKKYLREHPEDWHITFESKLYVIIQKEFPCNKN
jgi:hypothetical protein